MPFDWRELTPVSIVAFDQFVLWTNATAPYKTVKEFADAAKGANPPFKMGGTGSKREDHILTAFLEKRTGAKFAYLPYKSGGEAATQLVGNHTQANVNNPSENVEVWRAGQVRALCVFDNARIDYKDKVTGDAVLERHPDLQGRRAWTSSTPCCAACSCPARRSRTRPRSMSTCSAASRRRPNIKDYMKNQALKPVFLAGQDMVKFLEKDEALHKQLMTEAGFVATN